MRKNETLEQEQARKKAEHELPERIQQSVDRVYGLCEQVREMTNKLKRNHRSNDGGENSGKLL